MFSSHLDIVIIFGNLKCGLEFYFGLDFETNDVCHRILESNRPTKVSIVFSGFSWVTSDTFVSQQDHFEFAKIIFLYFCVVGGVWWGKSLHTIVGSDFPPRRIPAALNSQIGLLPNSG